MKCPKCKTKVAMYPLKDDDGKFIWKNLFKMDIVSLMFLIAIGFLLWSYVHDTEACMEMMENPTEYCATVGACNETIVTNELIDSESIFEVPIDISS